MIDLILCESCRDEPNVRKAVRDLLRQIFLVRRCQASPSLATCSIDLLAGKEELGAGGSIVKLFLQVRNIYVVYQNDDLNAPKEREIVFRSGAPPSRVSLRPAHKVGQNGNIALHFL